MSRFLFILASVGAAFFLTLLTILLSWLAHLSLGTAFLIVCAAATLGLFLMAFGYALALLEVRRATPHKSS